MAILVEDYLPPIKESGFNTNEPAAFGSTMSVAGAATFAGSVSISGTLNSRFNVISGSAATVQLTAAQSGSTILMDKADGIVFTLPNVGAGYVYDFIVTTAITSNSYKVVTFTPASQFILGNIVAVDSDSSGATTGFSGNGTTHVAVTQAAAASNATGGLKGSWLRFTSLSTTLWAVEGITQAAGTVTTPFATS